MLYRLVIIPSAFCFAICLPMCLRERVNMSKKILFIVTSHDQLGDSGKTGWYLPEVAIPYYLLIEKGCKIVFVSPNGGKAPMDPRSEEGFAVDERCQEFVKDKSAMGLINNTRKPSDVNACDFDGIFYAGGHGPMFDLPANQDIAKLAVGIYKAGNIVSAVGHGSVGLVPLKLQNGESLIKDKNVTCFTNAEEDAIELSDVMPFMLETRLKELGGNFIATENFQENVQVDGNLITGQNPESASGVAQEILKKLGL